MAGYTRQDTANNIANGNVIDADDFDAEYNQLESAFNASSGHSHDGTSGEGAPITKVGPSQDLVVSATQVLPKTTNTLDLGSASVQFKDAHFDGTVDADAFTGPLTGNVTGDLTGNVTGDLTGNVTGTVSDISNHDTDDLSEGSTNQYYTDARARGSISATGNLSYDSGTGVISFTQGDTDTVSEGSTNLYYTDARARSAVSVTDSGGDGSLAYNSSTGVITYTGPSASEVRAHISGGTGVTITDGSIAIGQAVGTASDVTFNDVTVSGDLTVSGTTTTVNTETINLADNLITLNSNYAGSSPTEDGGIEVERGTLTNKSLIWDESEDKWSVGSETFVASTFEGNVTGNLTGTVQTAAQPNITSLGTLTTLTVDDITINGSTISDAGDLTLDVGGDISFDADGSQIYFKDNGGVRYTFNLDATPSMSVSGEFTVDVSSDITLDADGGDIYLRDNNITAGRIDVSTANELNFHAGSSNEQLKVVGTGVNAVGGLRVGDTTAPTDNDIYAVADIEAGNDVTAGNDIIMTAGASDWKFEVGASNELNIYYGATKLFKLDSSGNLTVTGDVTAYGTIS